MPLNKLAIAVKYGSVFLICGSAHATEVTEQVSPGGQKYWHYPVENAKRTAVAIAWPNGIATLPAGMEMVSRIGIDVMLNGGADGKPPEEIIADFEDLDAGSRLFVQPEEIRGFIVTPDNELANAAAIANSVLLRPNLSQNWFEREQNKLAGQSRGRDKVVLGIGWNLSREILMGDHPYRNFWSIKPAANVDSASLSLIKDWHARSFDRKNVAVVATGSGNFDAIGAAIDKALEGLPSEGAEPPNGSEALELTIPGKTIIYHAPKATKSMILSFAKLPAANRNKELETNTALGVLGYGQQSRLFKAVRTGLRASYGFGAGYYDYTRKQRIFHMSGEVETAKLQDALNAVQETYEEFRTGGIGLIEFPFARRFYRQRIESSLAKPQDATFLLMEGRLNGAPMNQLSTLTKRIDDLERGKINGFIADTFKPFDQLLTLIVTPDAGVVEGDCVITAYDQWKTCF